MNNYSWLQQKLHQIALSSQFMREVTFDVENSIVSMKKSYEDHVFVSGLARSGTTILLNALYQSSEFASLSYKDMPFVLAPNLWSKLSLKIKDIDMTERAHGDGIKLVDSPHLKSLWMTFDDDDVDTKHRFEI